MNTSSTEKIIANMWALSMDLMDEMDDKNWSKLTQSEIDFLKDVYKKVKLALTNQK
jgi:hypothetical protein